MRDEYRKKISEHLKDSILDFSTLKNKSFLVTGAGGLIGSTLIDFLMVLNAEYEFDINVYALGRQKRKLENRFLDYANDSRLKIIKADVVEADALNIKIDYIVHAASPAHPLAFSKLPADVMKANFLGTLNMLELAIRQKARLLFLSSGEIYGISEDPEQCFKENDYGFVDILNSRSCYPESKRAAETLCVSYCAQYQADALIARLCHIYGPSITDSNSRADAQFLRNSVKHEDIVMKSPGTQTRSYCYVSDAVVGLLYILLRGTTGEAYNIANKKSIATIRQYAETLSRLSNIHIKNCFPPEIESKGYSKVMRAVLDASKLEKLGWMPKYNLEEGLKETYNLSLHTRNCDMGGGNCE